MNILVIFTGGTIGSRLNNGYISPSENIPYYLLERYQAAHPQSSVSFDTLNPYTILSENLSAAYLTSLVSLLWEQRDKGYDGIIVTHGTDTLQYSASAAAYALGESLSVVFVGANYPLEDKRSNGLQNFEAAVEQIATGKKGVFVTYQNQDGVVYTHHPNRLLSHQEGDDGLFSLPSVESETPVCPLGSFRLQDPSGILVLHATPGEGYAYSLEGVKAVLLRPYHSGTLNTESQGFRAFCRRAGERKIPLFAVNQPQGPSYESARAFKSLGILPLPPCALIPIYMKLWIALSQEKDPVSFLQKPLCREF